MRHAILCQRREQNPGITHFYRHGCGGTHLVTTPVAMSSSSFRFAFPVALCALALLACSGRTVGTVSGDGGSSSSSGGGSSSGSGGGSCVDIVVSSFDTSCQQDTDCVPITAGEICPGTCPCGGSAINASDQARYQQTLSSVQTGFCGCPEEPLPRCLQNVCTVCHGAPGDPPACNIETADAGQVDAQVCVNIDLSSYDQSCQTTMDCIGITSGRICTGDCACGGSVINVSGEARYQATIAGVMTEACPCVADGVPTCVQNQCILCTFGPNAPPGCPDGG
jgi:hypothetical protein